MKRVFSIFLCIILCSVLLFQASAFAANTIPIEKQLSLKYPGGKLYYVAKNGSDNNPGSLQKPFLSIKKAAGIMRPGDTCIIRKGVYRETVVPKSGLSKKKIRFAAFPNEKVVVSGADELKLNWQVYKDNIYKASVSFEFNQLFSDGQMMNEARWPNAEVGKVLDFKRATTESGTDTNGLKDSNLPQGDWNNATVMIWSGEGWTSWTRKIKDYKAGVGFTFDENFNNTQYIPKEDIPKEGNSYFISGSLAGLDTGGEWYLDKSKKELYFMTVDGKSPSTHRIEAGRRSIAFDLSNKWYVEIIGLDIFSASVLMENSKYCVVDGCNSVYAQHFTENFGFAGRYYNWANKMTGQNNEWRNSTISFTAGDGISVGGTSNKVTNCIIHDIDYTGGDYGGIGTISGCSLAEFTHNTIYNSGRFLIIHFEGKKVKISYNDLSHCGLLSKDCGATYSGEWDGQGTEISYNWVHDNSGDWVNGIYLDCSSNNFLVHHNVIWNITYVGLSLGSPSLNNMVYNNTIFNCGYAFNNNYTDESNQKGSVIINNLVENRTAFAIGDNAPYVANNMNAALDDKHVPIAGSAAIDAGISYSGLDIPYKGKTPDIGAYEFGGDYWKAGANINK